MTRVRTALAVWGSLFLLSGCREHPAPAPAGGPAPSLAVAPAMPDAILGKWRKKGGTGWHVFESSTLHYWTDGKQRNNHRIKLKQENGSWYIHWMDLERPSEKVELTSKNGKTIMHTIPTTRTGPVNFFSGGFSDETFVKEASPQ